MRDASVEIDGINIHYEESGSGRPVVLIHGFGASSFAWRPLRASLDGYRIIAPDLKGCGRSSKPADGHYGTAHQAELISGFIASLDLEDPVLVGHSLGGGVAIGAALLGIERGDAQVGGLVLIASMGFPQRIPRFIRVLRTPLLGEIAVQFVTLRLGVRMTLAHSYSDGSEIADDLVDSYVQHLGRPGARRALMVTARQIVPHNLDDIIAAYPSIHVPTLCIWGAEDVIVPVEIGRKLAAALPDAHLEVIDNCGHAPHEEEPARTAELIEGFLAES